LGGLLNFQSADKLFFHFFQTFFERPNGVFVARISRVAEEAKGWQAFFVSFFEIF
jgi:hypothetical protein